MVDSQLLEILACPFCKGDVELKGVKIVCKKCGRRYPVRDNIPVMLIEEAELPEKSKPKT
ncbi:Trm112 family protein [Patescibacteria group bacterium]|nr:Trm112 family protein [Patescibacteria group bacterium]